MNERLHGAECRKLSSGCVEVLVYHVDRDTPRCLYIHHTSTPLFRQIVAFAMISIAEHIEQQSLSAASAERTERLTEDENGGK